MSAVPVATGPTPRPLAISLLLGVSGWFAGLFMLAFVGLLFRPDTAPQAAVCGAVLLAAAWGLFRLDADGRQIFVAQIALALSIAGQCLMLFAMSEHTRGIAPIANAALLLQLVLVLLMPNRLHRTLSTLFATIAWALSWHAGFVGDRWFDDKPVQAVSLPAALAGWVLAWAPVAAALAWLIRSEARWATRGRAPLLQPVMTGLVIGLAFATLISQPFETLLWFDGGTHVGGLAWWPLLSALAALGAVAAAFSLRRRALMSIAIVAVLLHVAHFYYALGVGLLVKSVLMLAMGAAALLAARVLRAKENT